MPERQPAHVRRVRGERLEGVCIVSKVLKGAVSFAALLAIWQVLAVSGVFPSSLFPGPGSVAGALAERAESGQLLLDVGAACTDSSLGTWRHA